jgi:hypothetical protein
MAARRIDVDSLEFQYHLLSAFDAAIIFGCCRSAAMQQLHSRALPMQILYKLVRVAANSRRAKLANVNQFM